VVALKVRDVNSSILPERFSKSKRFRIKVLSWRESQRATRLGFFDLLFVDVALKVSGFGLHQRGVRRWISLPARPVVEGDGRQIWLPILDFMDHGAAAEFQSAALEAVDAFEARHRAGGSAAPAEGPR
jgi:hypothetical protein